MSENQANEETARALLGRVDQIRRCRDILGSPGNWDQGDYMLGYYNGIELCLAGMEDRPPQFKKLSHEEKEEGSQEEGR